MHELVAATQAWRETKFYDIVQHDNFRETADPYVGVQWVVKVHQTVPSDWSWIVGDILTNLRAALDHALHSVITSGAQLDEKILRRVQFPICDTEADFNNMTRAFRPFLSEAALDTLTEFQPYGEEPPHPLVWLRDLTNRDKHRALNIVTQVSTDYTFESDCPGLNRRSIAGKPIVDGQVLASARFPRPHDGGGFDFNTELKHIEHIEVESEDVPVPMPILLELIYEEVSDATALLTKPLHGDMDKWFIGTNLDGRDDRMNALRAIFDD